MAVLGAVAEMEARGLVEGTAGNVSVRLEDGTVLITPSALAYASMGEADLVVVSPSGETISSPAGRAPSSELALHLALYRALGWVGAVVHSHPLYASMFAVNRAGIPNCIDEFAMYIGGDVRCSRYAPSGTEEMAEAVVEAIADRSAALIANHGMVAVGRDQAEAVKVTALVERAAHIIWGASLSGVPVELPGESAAGFAAWYQERRQG
jgi:L-fuculose-phosphate aldolase